MCISDGLHYKKNYFIHEFNNTVQQMAAKRSDAESFY